VHFPLSNGDEAIFHRVRLSSRRHPARRSARPPSTSARARIIGSDHRGTAPGSVFQREQARGERGGVASRPPSGKRSKREKPLRSSLIGPAPLSDSNTRNVVEEARRSFPFQSITAWLKLVATLASVDGTLPSLSFANR